MPTITTEDPGVKKVHFEPLFSSGVSKTENAAQVAAQWGTPVGHAVIHQLVQRLGSRAESLAQKRLQETTPQARQWMASRRL